MMSFWVVPASVPCTSSSSRAVELVETPACSSATTW